MRFLATPDAAAVWAAAGGFLSPNLALDLSVYPDDVTRAAARALIEAGDAFHFDLSDLQPAAFGSDEHGGLQLALQELLRTGDAAAAAASIEQAAIAVMGPATGGGGS